MVFRDEKEILRSFFNRQYVKMKRMSAVGALILMAVNLAFTVYPYVEHRSIHPYVGVPLLFFGILLLVWFASHVYVIGMEMYRTESKAEIYLNPYAVYALAPRDEMFVRDVYLPMMETIYDLLPPSKQKTDMADKIQRVKGWCTKGFIPKQDFPEHLKEYYITDKQIRL